MVSYQLIRSKRKTIAIQITPEAKVLVKAPNRLPKAEIDRFVAQKEAWILSTRDRIQQEIRSKLHFDPLQSGTLSFLGKEYPIRTAAYAAFDGSSFLLPELPFTACKPLLQALYRKLAQEIITERVAVYSKICGLIPASVKITSANTRWGSCSGKNGLCFSWKLIFADLRAVDYVVVHELCHIREHNHSPRFWAEVEKILPDYRERRELLKQLQSTLAGQDWD